jgi:hypothetical protein
VISDHRRERWRRSRPQGDRGDRLGQKISPMPRSTPPRMPRHRAPLRPLEQCAANLQSKFNDKRVMSYRKPLRPATSAAIGAQDRGSRPARNSRNMPFDRPISFSSRPTSVRKARRLQTPAPIVDDGCRFESCSENIFVPISSSDCRRPTVALRFGEMRVEPLLHPPGSVANAKLLNHADEGR